MCQPAAACKQCHFERNHPVRATLLKRVSVPSGLGVHEVPVGAAQVQAEHPRESATWVGSV